MEDPDQLPPDLIEDIDDILSQYGDVPFVRRQHVVNMTHKVKNIKETKTIITIDFKYTHQRFWRSAEGVVTTIVDAFPPFVISSVPRLVLKYELDEEQVKCLWSPTERHSLVQSLLSYFDLTSPSELASLETQVSLCLFNLVSAAKDEGYSAIDVVVLVDVATVDTYDEEEVAQAMREPTSVISPAPRFCPAPRSSIEALLSQVFDDMISSDECPICLDGYSRGMTVTRLPCSHYFHTGCIERWLNVNNSCPICRSAI